MNISIHPITEADRSFWFSLDCHLNDAEFFRKVRDVDVFEKEKLYFLLAYPKNVQDNLTPDQKKQVRKLVEAIKKE